MSQRRRLDFQNFAQMRADIADLQSRGYQSTGKWSLGQICDHLAIVARLSMDQGVKPMPWIVRKLLARFFLRSVLKKRTMPAGFKAPAKLMPADRIEDHSGVARWIDVCDELQHQPRQTYFNPAFGPMGHQTFEQLQLIHAAHHLSFLVPNDPPA